MKHELKHFWMVFRDGKQCYNQPTKKHELKVDAEKEARRVAEQNPGDAVYVLKNVSLWEAEKPKAIQKTFNDLDKT